jgi:hypothetical protein
MILYQNYLAERMDEVVLKETCHLVWNIQAMQKPSERAICFLNKAAAAEVDS